MDPYRTVIPVECPACRAREDAWATARGVLFSLFVALAVPAIALVVYLVIACSSFPPVGID